MNGDVSEPEIQMHPSIAGEPACRVTLELSVPPDWQHTASLTVHTHGGIAGNDTIEGVIESARGSLMGLLKALDAPDIAEKIERLAHSAG